MKPRPTVRPGEVLRRSEETIELQPDAEYPRSAHRKENCDD
jgi:hypothetical protein